MDAAALLDDLDPDQRAAVTAASPLVAVIAGAGSGKTRVLTRRIAHRIASGTAEPRHTLALTFTREAAGELRRRLRKLGLREPVEAGTFHAVMLAVLRQRWADTDRRPLTIVADRRRLVREALGEGSRQSLEPIVAEIDWAAARGLGPAQYAGVARRSSRRPGPGVERCAEALEAYELLKRRRGVLDFDDVLAHTIRDLRRDPEFADALRWRFRHLLVDEAQDLNPLQHQLVDLLRAGRDDLFLVGDPSQAIYGFNGADPALLVEVEQRFPGIEVVRLPVNHRCTPQIVRAGIHVLDAGGQPAELASGRADGRHVSEVVADDEEHEARLVAGLLARTDPALVQTGNVAVLTRTHAQLERIESAVRRSGLPVRRAAARSPLQQGVREAASLGSASQLRAWAHDTLEADADDDLRRVAGVVLEFLREHPLGDGATFRAWVATSDPFEERAARGVELATFHASKGREWHTVVLAGVESGLVPHRTATTRATREEEARLLYVAMTRATDELVLARARRRGGYARAASPLLEGLTLDEPDVAPPPASLRRERRRDDALADALQTWRRDAARRAGALPEQICSDRDLKAIAEHRPDSPDALSAVTTLGPLTARRLAPEILDVVASVARG